MTEYSTDLIARVVRDYRTTVEARFERGEQEKGRRAAEALVKRWGEGPVRAAMKHIELGFVLGG
ncbi:hypothetical protein [Streptomyces sp. NPDC059604]|uniref:hypothetical protein n=1 Tax=Streptomyces sp. NPDC059604 TaxID=3346881 RepID=UPI00367CBFEF